MSVPLRNPTLATLFVAAAVIAHGGNAEAQRKPKPACGIKALPFIAGYQWVYAPVAPPEEVSAQAAKVAANKPKQFDKVTIKVASVEELEGRTEITLEEISEVDVEGETKTFTRTTKLSCVANALDVPPQSFFFVGEPGGTVKLEVEGLERNPEHHSYVFQLGTLRVPEWLENIKGKFARNSANDVELSLPGGSFDLQRIVKRGAPESITTLYGTYDATPVQVELVGSVTLAYEPPEEFSIPANTVNKLWIADNVGVVQVFNSNGHMFQLNEATLGDKK
ncbi:hypothetical protein [Haliangium sp.]|uniref:hypothetical protein n=1 Tax=Haliangium sp. TaxID=2663208 RepID=UPI003D0AFDCA